MMPSSSVTEFLIQQQQQQQQQLTLNAFKMQSHLWYFKVFLTFFLSSAIGWGLVHGMSNLARDSEQTWKLTYPFLITPLSIYTVLRFGSTYLECDGVVGDSFAFGVVVGIILKLYGASQISNSAIKLIVHDDHNKTIELSLDTLNGEQPLVGDARNKIAEAFRVMPANRILLESGKGGFIQDLSRPFITTMQANNISSTCDFFGSKIYVIYIKVSEDLKTIEPDDSDDSDKHASARINPRNIMAMLNARIEVKYGEDYQLLGKLPSSSVDTKPFHIHLTDKFLAGSLTPSHQPLPIRFEQWSKLSKSNKSVNRNSLESDLNSVSEVSASVNSTSVRKLSELHKKDESAKNYSVGTMYPSGLGSATSSITNIFKRHSNDQYRQLHNGDLVVLECDKKYLTVTLGWWLAWSSPVPRRSGAFIVELLERAPRVMHLNIRESIKGHIKWPSISLSTAGAMGPVGIEALGAMGAINTESLLFRDRESVTTTKNDLARQVTQGDTSVLHIGDVFRLRSIKFPEFELGITSERLNVDNCYLGLRKVKDKETDTWCLPLRLTLKQFHSSLSQVWTPASAITERPTD